MSNLKTNEEVSDGTNPVSTTSSTGSGSGIELPEVVITGSGSGSSSRTCSWCGATYDQRGFCPNCDYGPGQTQGSGSGSSSGSGSGLAILLPWPGAKHECDKNADCGENKVCYRSTVHEWFYIRKCRDMNNNEKSCKGLEPGDMCRLYGNPYTDRGWCSNQGGPVLICWSNPI